MSACRLKRLNAIVNAKSEIKVAVVLGDRYTDGMLIKVTRQTLTFQPIFKGTDPFSIPTRKVMRIIENRQMFGFAPHVPNITVSSTLALARRRALYPLLVTGE